MKFRNRYGLRSTAAAGCLALLLAVLFAFPALWAQETKEKVTVEDQDRNFMVRLPKSYDSKQHYPVVILLHGMNQDAEDIERLTRLLREMSTGTQFIVITHAKRTMEAAQALYGVTMQEPGVSKLVSVRFEPPPQVAPEPVAVMAGV